MSASSSSSSLHRNIVEEEEEEAKRGVITNGPTIDEATDIRDGGEVEGEGVVDGLGRRPNRARGADDDDAKEGTGSRRGSENITTRDETIAKAAQREETLHGTTKRHSHKLKALQNGEQTIDDGGGGERRSRESGEEMVSNDTERTNGGIDDDRHLEDFNSSHFDGDDVPDSHRIIRDEKTRNGLDRRGGSHEEEGSQSLVLPSPRQKNSKISEANDGNDLITEMSLGSTGVFRVELMPQPRADRTANGDLDSDDKRSPSANGKQHRTQFNAQNKSYVTVTHSRTVDSLSAGSSASLDASGSEQNVATTITRAQSNDSSLDRHDARVQELTKQTNHKTLVQSTSGILDTTEGTQRKTSIAVIPQRRTLVDDERQRDETKMTIAERATGNASTQTAFQSTAAGDMDDDDVQLKRTLSEAGGPSSKTVIELRSPGQNRPGIDSSSNIRREGSIIKRIILNDNDNAVCKITSIR